MHLVYCNNSKPKMFFCLKDSFKEFLLILYLNYFAISRQTERTDFGVIFDPIKIQSFVLYSEAHLGANVLLFFFLVKKGMVWWINIPSLRRDGNDDTLIISAPLSSIVVPPMPMATKLFNFRYGECFEIHLATR